MRADLDKARIELPQVAPSRKIELLALGRPRRIVRRGRTDRLLHLAARRELEALHPLDDRFHFPGRSDVPGEFLPLLGAHRQEPLARLMVPEPGAALDQPRADKERGRQAQALQDRVRDLYVALQAIVEG